MIVSFGTRSENGMDRDSIPVDDLQVEALVKDGRGRVFLNTCRAYVDGGRVNIGNHIPYSGEQVVYVTPTKGVRKGLIIKEEFVNPEEEPQGVGVSRRVDHLPGDHPARQRAMELVADANPEGREYVGRYVDFPPMYCVGGNLPTGIPSHLVAHLAEVGKEDLPEDQQHQAKDLVSTFLGAGFNLGSEVVRGFARKAMDASKTARRPAAPISILRMPDEVEVHTALHGHETLQVVDPESDPLDLAVGTNHTVRYNLTRQGRQG